MIWKGFVCTLILTGSADAASSWPPQLEMQVPFEPTGFSSGGKTYLTYELYLTNFAANPIALRRIEVLDAEKSDTTPITTFEAGQLDALLQPVGDQRSAEGNNASHQLAAGASIVVFLWIAVEGGTHIPDKLSHRVLTADFSAEGAVIGTHHNPLLVLGPPLRGADWLNQ